MQKYLLVILLLVLHKTTLAQNGTEHILVTDMLKIKTIGNITLSNDGRNAAFTVTSIEPDEKSKRDYKYRTQVYRTETIAGAVPLQLTTSTEGGSQPAWSPDGKHLVFTRVVNDKSQLFLLSMDGGEAVQLTNMKNGAGNPGWSPDGKQLLFSSSLPLTDLLRDSILNSSHALPAWSFEKPGITNNDLWQNNGAAPDPNGTIAQIRAYLDTNEANKKAIVLNKLNFQSESAISSDFSLQQFFLMAPNKDSSPVLITKGFYPFSRAAFTPDGKEIILSGDVDSLESPDRSRESQLFLVNRTGEGLRMILGEKDKTYRNATVSPGGKWIAFLEGNTSFIEVPTLCIMPLHGAAKDIVKIPFDRSIGTIRWGKDDNYFYFSAASNGGTLLYKVDVRSRKPEALSGFEAGITSFDVQDDKIVYSKTQVANPSALFMADGNMKKEQQLGNFNDWVKDKKLSLPEKHNFVNDKGMRIEYWVMKPSNYEPGKKYPLLLEIHGGPSAMWGPGEASMWHEFQYFCSQGYGVVYSNPRGSGGYGVDFLRGNIKDWGAGPSSDVLTALDKTVQQGWADTSKLLITGGSYAGYLTAWIVGHDKRFKAACSQRGVYDLATFFGEGNAWRLVPEYFGGYPWEPGVKALLERESPTTYVQNITTPYIIFHGGNDRRTGFVSGEMMFRSLKALGRPVEYVVHPGATHEITRNGDNRQRIDQLLRTYEFFERWMK